MSTRAEIFPVITKALPPLAAYALSTSGGDLTTIGGKLAYRLAKSFGGHWVWTSYRVVTDTPRDDSEINGIVKKLWNDQGDVFRYLKDVRRDAKWVPRPQALADFVARGLIRDADVRIRAALAGKSTDLGNAQIERIYEARGWTVGGEPAVSISITSRLALKQDLKDYASTVRDPHALIDLWVAAKNSSLKGTVVRVEGRLKESRVRLSTLTADEWMLDYLEKAPDEELIVVVNAWHTDYEYPIGALRIILRTEEFKRFGVNASRALKVMRISPQDRYDLVRMVVRLANGKGVLGNGYDSASSPSRFLALSDLSLDSRIEFGGGHVQAFDQRVTMSTLQKHGLYRKAARFKDGAPLKVAILDAVRSGVAPFWTEVSAALNAIDLPNALIGTVDCKDTTPAEVEKAYQAFDGMSPDVILALLPDSFEEDEDADAAYHHLKTVTIKQAIASQVVHRSTMSKRFAVPNIVLGIAGKTGNIPFVLPGPLPFADLVVGIDIARQRKKKLEGSVSATAIARIYLGNGEFLRYVIHDAPLEGETVPEEVLRAMFPLKEFKGKRVVIQRDGFFRGEEKTALKDWAKSIGAEFLLVEIIKSGTPRLYSDEGGRIGQPPKGSAIKLDDHQALLVSSLPPFKDATPQPLRVRAEPPLTVEDAIRSIIPLTWVHYGSVAAPRLPVTIHYSDRIAYLALKGIKPKDLEGTIPFWL